MKFQLLLGLIIIACAIGTVILTAFSGSVEPHIFYIWIAVVIIFRLHILALEKGLTGDKK